MKSVEIRKAWKNFWEGKNTPIERKHVWSDPSSLIVNSVDDPTTLFNSAGMQPLVPYLMGKEHPSGSKRVYNIQGCVRTTDIDEVGDASHLTFFEMMGNWSLGDYFKNESVQRSYDFLVNVLKLDPKRLCVSVFEGDKDAPKDDETAQLWKEQGLPEHKIAYLGKSDNRRGPAGATGPCGPDTEIFYRVGAEEFPPESSNVGNDEHNRMEIWNNVFMAYYKDEKGNFSELAAKNVDTGMGFERICMVVQHAAGHIQKPLKEASVYDTDLFKPMLEMIVASNIILPVHAQRIIADHARTALKLVHAGLVPSNESRGYVLRRIIRRMYFQWTSHGGTVKAFETILYHIKEHTNTIYDGECTNQSVQIVLDEINQFAKTLNAGEKIVNEMIAGKSGGWTLDGISVFKLYDTYGFPVELTQEIVEKAGGKIDKQGFDAAMEQAQERSRSGSEQKFSKMTDRASLIEGVAQTEFVGYEHLETENVRLIKDARIDGQRVIITDRTPFYAEGGGQTGDSGIMITDGGETIHVSSVINYGGVFIHLVQE